MTAFNLVFCKHYPSGKHYLFQAPLNVSLHSGDRVFVSTKNGASEAVVANENFIVNKGLMKTIAEGVGAYLPLAVVQGRAVEVTKIECCHFNEDVPLLPF